MLGALRTELPWVHALGVGLVAGMILLWTRLQHVALRLKAQEQESRWASTLRDLLNLLLVATLWVGFYLTGLPGPAAFLFAGTVGVALDVLRHVSSEAQRRTRWMLIGVLPVAVLLALFPGALLAWINRVVGLIMSA